MKSSYELAMERLNKNSPAVKLTAAQKQQLAELDSQYAAKIAGREIAMQSAMAGAAADLEQAEKLRAQWIQERQQLQAELEARKDQIRHGASR